VRKLVLDWLYENGVASTDWLAAHFGMAPSRMYAVLDRMGLNNRVRNPNYDPDRWCLSDAEIARRCLADMAPEQRPGGQR